MQKNLIHVFSNNVFVKNNKESLLAENIRLKKEIESLQRVISSYKGVLTRQNKLK